MMFDLQKASMWKRISAFLFDFILWTILVAGVAYLISVITNYDTYSDTLNAAYAKYETQYETSFNYTQDEYDALDDTQKAAYDQAYQALLADEEAIESYNMVINLTFLIIPISVFVAYMLLDFVVPLIYKNGQTFGKKIFGIGVMRTDAIRATPIFMFIRTMLGKYTLETMIPVVILLMLYFNMIGLLGLILLGGILLLQIILMIATKTNSPIHDILASTVVVDMTSQMIFDTRESQIEHQAQEAQKRAANKPY